MTNRDYIKQKMKEYYCRKIDEAEDCDLWSDYSDDIQRRENIMDAAEPDFDYIFNCAICKAAFGHCLTDTLTCREYFAYADDPNNQDDVCDGRFFRYLDMERERRTDIDESEYAIK